MACEEIAAENPVARNRDMLNQKTIDDITPSDIAEWQIAGIKRAIESVDRGGGIPHERVIAWAKSWGGKHKLPMPMPPKHENL